MEAVSIVWLNNSFQRVLPASISVNCVQHYLHLAMLFSSPSLFMILRIFLRRNIYTSSSVCMWWPSAGFKSLAWPKLYLRHGPHEKFTVRNWFYINFRTVYWCYVIARWRRDSCRPCRVSLVVFDLRRQDLFKFVTARNLCKINRWTKIERKEVDWTLFA